MIAYLTSHIGACYIEHGERIASKLFEENGFLGDLQKHWKADSNVLIVSADPDAFEMNDGMRTLFSDAFLMSELGVKQMDICDRRDETLVNHMSDYDVVILAGGHVPTQNAFFKQINLKEQMGSFDGILIGISAGSMNSAEVVYAQPELDGESTDPAYQRFLTGLGITKLMLLPHYQAVKDAILDGRRLFEDITYPDSFGREFYALTDGSYVKIADGKTRIFGEAYLIKEGKLKKLCGKENSVYVE